MFIFLIGIYNFKYRTSMCLTSGLMGC